MKILLVRLRQIGDVVFTTPAVAALRHAFPDARLTYLVEPAAAPIVSNSPRLDEVRVVARRGGFGGFAADIGLGLRLRRERYDLAIDFHGGPRASLLTWLSGARTRIGYQVPARQWMYTDLVERPRELRPRHAVENQWDLLGPLGIARPAPDTNPVEMTLDPTAAASVDRRLSAAGAGEDDVLVVMHVSASSPFRRWPLQSFVDTVAALAAQPGRRIIVSSGPSERTAAADVAREARAQLPEAARERVLDCGDFSLIELRALLERSSLYIGGDSGPLHLASTTRVPIVALFGPTLPVRSAPWRDHTLPVAFLEVDGLPCRPCDQRTCEPGDFRCLTRLDSARVIDAAERLLAYAPRREPR